MGFGGIPIVSVHFCNLFALWHYYVSYCCRIDSGGAPAFILDKVLFSLFLSSVVILQI